MRVLHLISGLSTGGTEMMLHRLLRDTDRTAAESMVVSLTAGGAMADSIRSLGVPVQSLDMRRGMPNPLAALRLVSILRRFRPDVLQTWLYHADLLGLVAGRLAGVPVITWNIRCSTMDERYRRGAGGMVVRLLAKLSRWPDAIVVNSTSGRVFHESLGYRPRRWVMIPNGFDLQTFRPDRTAYARLRTELDLAPNTPLVGLVARADPIKDHPTFLLAAAQLRSARPDVHFVLAGGGVDKGNRALAEHIAALRLDGAVHLLGERKDVAAVTAALDLATCSSLSEGFPNVVGEALACGVPVVSTDVGDAAMILGDAGAIVPPSDAVALAAAWGRLLSLPLEQRSALGARGRESIGARFDLHAVAARYVAFYRELSAVRQPT